MNPRPSKDQTDIDSPWPMTRFVTTSRGMYATVPLLIVVLTIIFTLACGADNTTPVPTSETPADSPTTAQETTAGPTDTPGAASTSSPTPAAVATPTASAAPSPRVGPTPAPEPTGTREPTPAPTAIFTPVPSPTAPPTLAVTPIPTAAPDPTPTPTAMPAPAPTATPTPVATRLPTTPPMTTPAVPLSGQRLILTITVAEAPADIPVYDRGEWKHWTDADRDCQDARQEVLIEESLEAVTFETEKECRVATGRWWAPYLAHHLGNPGHIDVDHHVPLKNAHLSGGWRWDAARKEAYANYLESPDHLIAISARHNRSKGARGPDEWKPPDQASWCQYALAWTEIKHSWELTMTSSEHGAIATMLATCGQQIEIRIEAADHPDNLAGEDNTPPTDMGALAMWDDNDNGRITCAEARAHGIAPVHRGHPAYEFMRDADGDGVVCE